MLTSSITLFTCELFFACVLAIPPKNQNDFFFGYKILMISIQNTEYRITEIRGNHRNLTKI